VQRPARFLTSELHLQTTKTTKIMRRGFILVAQPTQAAFETASFEMLAPKQQQHLTDLYHDHMQVRLRQGL